ncbi:hypothetical protein [Caenimonas koreensis]|uniref:hypothetical protein n=1 Tax=Caenimonas koreensis TaxID=367474 RepID=UPI003783FF82
MLRTGALRDVAPFPLIAVVVPIVALLLIWPVVYVNVARGCVVGDTHYLPLCTTTDPQPSALREHLAANPGETPAYVELAGLAPTSTTTLAAAQRLAPTHPKILLTSAVVALQRGDLKAGIAPLIDLTEYHRDNYTPPVVLARLVAAGRTDLLVPYLRPGSIWPASVLTAMRQAGGSTNSALPLITKALAAKALDRTAVSAYVEQLKADRAWGDAYALWLTLHTQPLPILYNGSFDEPFLSEGFDWEVNAPTPIGRAGAVVDRVGYEARGATLNVKLAGRSIATPLIRQYVFISNGRYRLKGEYRTRRLRLEPSLVWTIRCTSDIGVIVSRSEPLPDTDTLWQPFGFEFALPATCGPVAIVQLEPGSNAAAVAGGSGEAWFDALTLERLAN